jgi:hypothetical protein
MFDPIRSEPRTVLHASFNSVTTAISSFSVETIDHKLFFEEP